MKSKHVVEKLTSQVNKARFADEILAGLTSVPKRVSPKFFYDEAGSELFEAICDLPEYYPTRTEIGLLQNHSAEFAQLAGSGATVIELGSGSSRKSRILLSALTSPAYYVPIDVSREFLIASASRLANDYPGLRVVPVVGDYTQPLELPSSIDVPSGKRLVFFPGSTIGNLDPVDAEKLLRQISSFLVEHGGCLIGVDLRKDVNVLVPAYDDAQGVTEKFNKNLLHRLNRELGANFIVDNFEHVALFNEAESRVEMHLRSRVDQRVQLQNVIVNFRQGETIHTENSYKYTTGKFASLANRAGLRIAQSWTDPKNYFAIFFLENISST